MKPKFFLLLAVALPLAGLLVWAGVSAWAGSGRELDYYTSLALSDAGISVDELPADNEAPPAGPPPRLELDEVEHLFGTMDVGQKGRHEFLVRNTGQGDLRLQLGQTSCKCTLVDIPNGVVPPGGECRVELAWETPKPERLFRHGAYIQTNDPACPEFSLRVCGKVRDPLAIVPESVVFTGISPRQRPEAEALICSDVWTDLEIIEVEATMPDLAWELRPADPAALAARGALSGQRLMVRLGADLPVGTFVGQLKLRVRQAGQPEVPPLTRFLNVEGSVVPDISVLGPGYRRAEGLQLGLLAAGEGARRKLHLFVQGEHRDLVIREIRVRPEIVSVRVTRDEHPQGTKTHFLIDIEIPPEAPGIDCLGLNEGEIAIITDHPQTPEMRIPLGFAIESKR